MTWNETWNDTSLKKSGDCWLNWAHSLEVWVSLCTEFLSDFTKKVSNPWLLCIFNFQPEILILNGLYICWCASSSIRINAMMQWRAIVGNIYYLWLYPSNFAVIYCIYLSLQCSLRQAHLNNKVSVVQSPLTSKSLAFTGWSKRISIN